MRIFKKGEEDEVLTEIDELKETVRHASMPETVEKVALKEIQLTGSFAQKWSAWKRALSLMGGSAVDLKSLISHRYPLTR